MHIMNLSEIMDRSIEILKKYLETVSLFSIGYGIICGIEVFVIILIGAILGVIYDEHLAHPVVLGIIIYAAVLLVFTIIVSLNAGIIKISTQDFTKEKIYTAEAIKISFKNILRIFGLVTVSFVLFIPVAAAFAAIIYFIYSKADRFIFFIIRFHDMNASGIHMLISAAIVIFAFLFVILLYMTWIIFSLHALVIEKKRVFASIKRSFELVGNNFWKIFGCIIIFNISVIAIRFSLESIVGASAGIAYFIFKFLSIKTSYIMLIKNVEIYAAWPLTVLYFIFVSHISTVMISLLYFNQRFKKEGYDMVLKLEQIQKNQENRKGNR